MFEFKLCKAVSQTVEIDASFCVHNGKITTLIGKSGAGKSTILNLITGLLSLDSGYVRTVDKDYTLLPVHQRGFGYIQQQSLLFGHLSVKQNLLYSSRATEKELDRYLDLFELRPHLDKLVNQLSGGESQRVSIVRTLMSRPKLLLFDEAFNALDFKLRSKLKKSIVRLKQELNIPIIFVTHELTEAYEISDEIVVIEDGTVVESGDCKKIFNNCRDVRTARLLAIDNIFEQEMFSKIGMAVDESCDAIGIKANQISLEDDGILAHVVSIKERIDDVVIGLEVTGLSDELVVKMTYQEYDVRNVKVNQTVFFKIHRMIYLRGDL